ncbi:MAG: acylphosphatase [Pirellulaceae bacterium]|nr:MAG: acylphosphatase [Pirellulaceae bacterium]
MERVTVRYLGRVQGVGFRATAAHLAQGFEVTGFVRNVHDGSVELVAEGEPPELRKFLNAIATQMGNKIVEQREQWEPIERRTFDRFTIEASI